MASRGRFLGYFKVFGELKKDSRWFICTKYDLKYILECRRGDKNTTFNNLIPYLSQNPPFLQYHKIVSLADLVFRNLRENRRFLTLGLFYKDTFFLTVGFRPCVLYPITVAIMGM